MMKRSLEELAAVLWIGAAKVAEKEGKRDDLVDGQAYAFAGQLALTIDGTPLVQPLSGRLLVGHATTKNASHTPKLAEVLATILLTMAKKKRAELLNAIVVNFEAGGCVFPTPPAAAITEAEDFLAKLRTFSQEPVRGSVKAAYQLAR